MSIPSELKYTTDHEWVRLEGDFCVIGITDHAQSSLGDVTYVEMPEKGTRFEAKAIFGVVESVKAASDLYMPLPGEVVEINDALEDSPELVNSDPYGSGWMIRVRPDSESDFDALLDSSSYESEIGA